MDGDLVIALVAGVLQGIFEWLPISSEGNVSIVLSTMGYSPLLAVQYSLFLHLGTALAATAYYRDDLLTFAIDALDWRPGRAFDDENAVVTFLVLATLVSGVVGVFSYLGLKEFVTSMTGGVFVAVVGLLLMGTGLLQRYAGSMSIRTDESPTTFDAVLVGVMQGLAILPGVSRSGTTVSALLLRGYEGPQSIRFSFLLSIPAATGAALLVAVEKGAGIDTTVGAIVIALGASAAVGYLTIDALTRLVERVAFWAVCVGLGGLAVVGGLLVYAV